MRARGRDGETETQRYSKGGAERTDGDQLTGRERAQSDGSRQEKVEDTVQ